MFKVSLFLFHFIRLLFCCLGGELPERTPDRATVCAGTPLRGSCPSGEVVAVKHIKYGTKANCFSASCCDYDANDCLIDYTYTAQQAACSAKEVNDEIIVAQTDTSSCGDPYPIPGLNNYLTMEYYCIPESRINNGLCNTNSIQSPAGTLVYLQNTDYPNPIRAETLEGSCSVEANTCKSQIRIYYVHFELGDGTVTCTNNQAVNINDEMSVHTYTCSDKTNYEITHMMTSSSNYISVELENTAGVYEGKFWLGFEATDTAASLRIDCPVRAQTQCKECDWLESLTNGAISYSDNTIYQSVATFSCNTGYSLKGSSTRECQINGNWSHESPSCSINDCGNLRDPANGLATHYNGTTYQSVVLYNCDAGYTLSGLTTRICQADENWSNSEPTCQINDCGTLADPQNGSVTHNNGTIYQSVATYSCNTGFTLSGDATRICQADKSWSNSEPRCEINGCDWLESPTDGTVSYSDNIAYQSVATFGCNTGYYLVGSVTRNCEIDGTWSNDNPTCVANDCSWLESPTDCTVSYSDNTTYQSVATFRCNAGYILEGSTTRKCGKDGTWSNDNPSCVNNDCAALYKRHWWILLIFFATQVLYMM